MALDLDVVYQATQSILSFCLIGCLGYFLAKHNWFTAESKALLTRLITQVTLPIYLLWNINTVMTRDQLASLAYGLPAPMVSMLLAIGLGFLGARLLGVPATRRGIFCTLIGFSNAVYIGIPVNQALFGEAAMPYALLYYIAQTLLFWSLGNYLLASDNPQSRTPLFSLGTVKKILTPPMYAFLLGMLLLLFELRLPPLLATTAKTLGNTTTPLVLLSIGVTLHDLGLKNIRFTRELASIFAARFVLAPLLIVFLVRLLPLPDLMQRVFVIQASLPAMSTIPMLSAYYGTETEYATVAVSATTLASVVTIPVYIALLTVG